MTNKKEKKDNIILNALILCAITVIAGVLLGYVYEITKEPIRLVTIEKTNAALGMVIADASFELIEDLDLTEYDKIKEVYTATINDEVVGYGFTALGKGYAGDIEIAVGIDVEGKISGIDIINHKETVGLGSKIVEPTFRDLFVGKPASELVVVKGGASNENEIAALTGATISSKAVTEAVNTTIDFFNNELKKEAE